jgi:hypothetical protein
MRSDAGTGLGLFITATIPEQPFDSIDSGYDFMDVLAETVLDAMKDLHREDCPICQGPHTSAPPP